uniref:IRG-type G domain-containing protein n=1 Tax=Panagrolaimus superbus TaxID=310955 RepID=A0A914Y1C4_9BILA
MSRFFSRVDYKSQKDNAGLKLGIDKTRYNIAIAGHTKIGKSTLVNTLIGKKLAKTGPAETTNHVAKYDSIIIPGVTVWDFAGCGTRKHNVETYYM